MTKENVIVFPHIGDTHLHPGPRQEDRLRALDQIIRECESMHNLGAWLWPGDIFDRRSTVEDRNHLKERVKRMGDRAPVLILYGNHDCPGDLDIFADIEAAWPIHVVSTPQVVRIELAAEDGGDGEATAFCMASIFCLPFPTEAGLVGRGVSPGEIVQEARKALDSIFIDAGEPLRAAQERGEITMMLGHVNVSGSVSSTGQPSVGQEIELDSALLDRLPPCYVGLNHIHKAQRVGRAVYAGSACRLNWGETELKGYVVVGYGRAGWVGFNGDGPHDVAGTFWDWDVKTCPIDVAPMYHVEGEFDRNGFSWKVTDGPDGAPMPMPAKGAIGDPEDAIFRGCEVRARMRYKQSEGVVLADAQRDVRELFERMGCSRFEFEPVCVPDRGLRAPEVVMAKSLSEKLAAWARVAGVVLPETVALKVSRLETADPDVVAREVEDTMAALTAEPEQMKEVERVEYSVQAQPR